MMKPKPNTLCLHCGTKRVSRPRGLCWFCYYCPGVRGFYASGNPRASRGVMAGANPVLAATAHLPRSGDKLAVLAARAAAGESLFHPGDARHAD